MNVDNVQIIFNYIISVLRENVPPTLGVILAIQLIYVAFLNLSIRSARPSRRRDPSEPRMPTRRRRGTEYELGLSGATDASEAVATATQMGEIAQPRMVILTGIPNVSEIDLPLNDFIIGRFYNPTQNVQIALDERSISRRHAMFTVGENESQFFLHDAGSTYGTSIRRGETFEPLTPNEKVQIFNGDVVQFGSVVTVRFVLPSSGQAYNTDIA